MTLLLWRPTRLCLPVLALACGSAFAQAAVEFDPMVVTATRNPVPLRDVLADVTVIDRAALERRVGGVGDVLRTVPGFQMVRNGGPAGSTSLFVRGGESRFTAVLIDGVRVDTQTTGGATWEAIPLSQIDRIEILRGPGSAVYGSDAIGGVVQIFTRRGEPGVRVDAGLLGGGFGDTKADASVSGARGRVDYALSALSEHSHGYSTRTTGNADRDGYQSRGGSGRLGVAVAEGHRLEASFLRSHIDGQYDAATSGAAKAADDHGSHDLDTLRAAWTARWSPAASSALNVGQSKDHYETLPTAPYRTDTRVRTATWQNGLRLGHHVLDATLERREDALVNSGVARGGQDRAQNGLALGYGWRNGGHALQVNVRHDDNDRFGSVNTGSLAAGADVAPGWRLQSSVSNGFRAPTLYQMYSQYGVETLKPERARSNLELALHHHAGAFDSSVTAYRNRIVDLIQFATAPVPSPCATTSCYANVGNARLQGVTLASAWAGDGLRVSGSIDVLSAKNLDTGLDLARRARRHATLNIDREIGDTTVGVQWHASARRFDNAANTTVLGGYSTVNLDLQHRIDAEWKLQARIDNLFDRTYQTASSYTTDPMTAWFGVRWTPKI